MVHSAIFLLDCCSRCYNLDTVSLSHPILHRLPSVNTLPFENITMFAIMPDVLLSHSPFTFQFPHIQSPHSEPPIWGPVPQNFGSSNFDGVGTHPQELSGKFSGVLESMEVIRMLYQGIPLDTCLEFAAPQSSDARTLLQDFIASVREIHREKLDAKKASGRTTMC